MNKRKSRGGFTTILRTIKRHNASITIGIIIILILSIFLFADRGFIHFYQSYDEREELKKEIQELEKKKEMLQEEKDKLQNDPKHIEKVAREKYKMKKKDEKVYQIEMEKDK